MAGDVKMINAFHWQGKPSIFTTGKSPHMYSSEYVQKHFGTSLRNKPSTISLSGGSPYQAPVLMKTKRAKK